MLCSTHLPRVPSLGLCSPPTPSLMYPALPHHPLPSSHLPFVPSRRPPSQLQNFLMLHRPFPLRVSSFHPATHVITYPHNIQEYIVISCSKKLTCLLSPCPCLILEYLGRLMVSLKLCLRHELGESNSSPRVTHTHCHLGLHTSPHLQSEAVSFVVGLFSH